MMRSDSAFPDMRGFSSANLWRMKQFYLTHTSAEFLAHVAQEMEKPVSVISRTGCAKNHCDRKRPGTTRTGCARIGFGRSLVKVASTTKSGMSETMCISASRRIMAAEAAARSEYPAGKIRETLTPAVHRGESQGEYLPASFASKDMRRRSASGSGALRCFTD
ncbi:MAG: DUF1016 domain-containing protein [Candidatus Hydrogenedens sp.]|nr:DUF1016 domain-containing protein [Candidatus Hydrogenedens sp.]